MAALAGTVCAARVDLLEIVQDGGLVAVGGQLGGSRRDGSAALDDLAVAAAAAQGVPTGPDELKLSAIDVDRADTVVIGEQGGRPLLGALHRVGVDVAVAVINGVSGQVVGGGGVVHLDGSV